MSSLNRVQLIGRLGKDPEIRATQGGARIANFSVATSESWTDKASGEKKERTEWHNVAVFNEGLVGVIERFVKRGDMIFVEGQLQTRKWQDKEGQDRYTTEVVLRPFVGQIVLLGGRKDGGAEQGGRGGGQTQRGGQAQQGGWDSPPAGSGGAASTGRGTPNDLDDEIPF